MNDHYISQAVFDVRPLLLGVRTTDILAHTYTVLPFWLYLGYVYA